MTKLFSRWQQKKTRDVLKYRRVVVIYGPRQSGKTTLAQQLRTKQDTFVSLDDPMLLTTALKDPIKAGSAVSASDYKHMVWFKNNIAKENPFCGIVLYTGEHSVSLGEDMYAVPIAALWN